MGNNPRTSECLSRLHCNIGTRAPVHYLACALAERTLRGGESAPAQLADMIENAGHKATDEVREACTVAVDGLRSLYAALEASDGEQVTAERQADEETATGTGYAPTKPKRARRGGGATGASKARSGS